MATGNRKNSSPLAYLTALSLVLAAFCVSKPTQAADQGPQVLWNEWYTVTLKGKVHYGYYNEKIELKNGQIFAKNDFLKQEEDYINRENLVAVAENNNDLSPVLFNFHSVYRSTETVIDGTVKNAHFLSVRVKKGDQQLPVIERTIPAKAFFSALFSVWVGKHLHEFTEGKTVTFESILEDDVDQQFQVMEGSIKLLKPDAFAKSTNTTMLQVVSRGIRTTWWVNAKGAAQKIEMPEQDIVVERVTQEQAKKFLGGAT